MFSNFVICVKAVLPLMIYLGIGAVVRKGKLLSGDEVHRINHMVFLVFFPVLMFDNLYSAKIDEVFDLKLIILAVSIILGVFVLSIPFVSRIEKDPRKKGVMVQGIYRSNFVIMGIPISINIMGAGNVASTAILLAVIVPLYNVLAVFILEYYRGGKADWKDIGKRIATNPIILGALTAIVFLFFDWHLPDLLEGVVSDMSHATGIIALILLGASFDYRSVSREKRNLIICIVCKLLVVPAIGISLAILLGFTDAKLVAILAMCAAPTAVSSFTMAESMEGDGELAGNIVIFSTPISCITIFCWLFLLKSLGLI